MGLKMDLTMILGGFAISVCQALDADGARTLINTLEQMGDRPAVSPAEAHIFRTVAEALKAARSRPRPRLVVDNTLGAA